MDLRPYKPTAAQIELATDLACRGLLCYQPFIFSDELQTGAGFEFAQIAEFAGLVYCTNPPKKYRGNRDVERHLIDPTKFEQLLAAARVISPYPSRAGVLRSPWASIELTTDQASICLTRLWGQTLDLFTGHIAVRPLFRRGESGSNVFFGRLRN